MGMVVTLSGSELNMAILRLTILFVRRCALMRANAI
jgi:hypothetical protein